MKINYNVSAMVAHRSLSKNDNSLTTSLERLSSGYKINHAKDNASGLAMAKRMNAQIRSLDTANQNANDGVSAIDIAEGALSEISEMVQRMSELSVKASNGTLTDADRENINDEIQQLMSEVERVAKTTMYNGEVLLDGSFDLKGYTDDLNTKVVTYGNTVKSGEYTIDSITATITDGKIDPASFSITLGNGFPADIKTPVEVKGDSVFITNEHDFEIELQLTGDMDGSKAVKLDITGIGAMGVQIGTNEGQILDVRIPTISLRAMGLKGGDVLTEDTAKEFMDRCKQALNYVNSARSTLGAYSNRLEYTIKTLDISEENMTAAFSRIMDTDMSEEMTEYSKNTVLVQAGTSMLAQANERPSQVLQLLQ